MSSNPDIPTRRGRRDPELAAMLDADNLVDEPHEAQSAPLDTDYQLYPGDVIMGKTTLAYRTPMGDAWSTFGAQTHVMQGEDVDGAFERLSAIVNSGVIELGKDAVDRVNEVQAELNGPQRITPRS
jgi:hypothetical protein